MRFKIIIRKKKERRKITENANQNVIKSLKKESKI